jgi:beta-fructofuranosidase
MTCPRELRYQDGKPWQTPVRELEQLREDEHHWQGVASNAPVLDATRLEFG